jgi:D-alanyl-lipoteichoic acid acyltransferase DltB (MBOAT superfamily)
MRVMTDFAHSVDVPSIYLALKATLGEHAFFLRVLVASAAFTALVQVWRRPLPVGVAAAASVLCSALVLREALPAFLAINGIGFLLVHSTRSSRSRWIYTVGFLFILTVVFLVARHQSWDSVVLRSGPLAFTWFYLDMWMFLRLFVLLWEVGAGKQNVPELLPFTAWAASPFFLAGPLLRCSEWPGTLTARTAELRERRWWTKVLTGVSMWTIGLLFVGFLRRSSLGAVNHTALEKLSIIFLLGPWGFYLTVAGAFLFIEALAALNGVIVRPSFEAPFFQPNVAEFWARWNMTVTSVFREFFFYNRWGLRTFNPYVNTVLVFLAVGLWHGSNLYWIVFGLLHGLYFSVYLSFRSRSGGRRLRGQRIWAIAVTYYCVCLAWYIPSKVAALVQR